VGPVSRPVFRRRKLEISHDHVNRHSQPLQNLCGTRASTAAADPPPRSESPACPPGRGILAALLLAAAGWLACACANEPRPAVTQPATAEAAEGGHPRPDLPPAKPALTAEAPPSPPAAAKPPDAPKRPAPSWAIFREAFDEQADAACDARWTGGRRLEVTTHNVRLLTIDISRLPPEAPEAGPWNLQIDRQGIQITGLRSGRKALDLVRSRNGDWTVVPGSHRPRP
jgi:hypothetical protein